MLGTTNIKNCQLSSLCCSTPDKTHINKITFTQRNFACCSVCSNIQQTKTLEYLHILQVSLFPPKVKVKCTLVQALRHCTGRTTLRGSRCIAPPFLDHGTRRGWGVSITPWLLFISRKDPVPIVQESGWALGPVWKGGENFASTGIRSPDCPARSQSLYRLRYAAHSYSFWRRYISNFL